MTILKRFLMLARQPRTAAILLLSVAAAAVPRSAMSEIVVFKNGRHLQITGTVPDGDNLVLLLENGGTMRVSLAQIETVNNGESPIADTMADAGLGGTFGADPVTRAPVPVAPVRSLTAIP